MGASSSMLSARTEGGLPSSLLRRSHDRHQERGGVSSLKVTSPFKRVKSRRSSPSPRTSLRPWSCRSLLPESPTVPGPWRRAGVPSLSRPRAACRFTAGAAAAGRLPFLSTTRQATGLRASEDRVGIASKWKSKPPATARARASSSALPPRESRGTASPPTLLSAERPSALPKAGPGPCGPTLPAVTYRGAGSREALAVVSRRQLPGGRRG